MQSLDLLRHLVENTGLMPLVKGAQGAGKTSLLVQFQKRAADSWVLCRIDANPMMHSDQLLSQLAKSCGVTGDGSELETLLRQRLEDLGREDRLPVVVVDDAHLLPVETLIQLIRLHQLQDGDSSLVHVVLFALPQIEELLGAPELRAMDVQGEIRPLQIPAFTLEQTRAFIAHCFNTQGMAVSGLSSSQQERIYHESHGLPGRVQELVLKLIYRGVAPVDESGPALRKRYRSLPLLAAGMVAALLLLVLLLFQDGINALFEGGEAIDQPVVIEERSAPGSEIGMLSAQDEAEPPVPEEEVLEPVVPLPLLVADEGVEESPVLLANSAESAANEIGLPLEDVKADEAPVSPSDSVEGQELEPLEELLPEGSLPAKEEGRLPAPPPEPQAKVDPLPQPKDEKGLMTGVYREEWLLQQDPSAYTWQLLGVRDEVSLKTFIEKHKLQDHAAYFQTVRQGRPWFALLYGAYPDRKAAMAARGKQLPSLAEKELWLRQFKDIQKDIPSP